MSTPDFEQLDKLAALVGLSREDFITLAMKASGTMNNLREEAEEAEKPPPIVYPNVKFPRYKFREYPKLLYKGYIRDIEEPVIKLVPRSDGHGVEQVPFIRVIPDQFVQETQEVGNNAEEAMRVAAGWFMTRGDAIEAAKAAKAGQRPIIERPAPSRRGRPPKVNVSTVIEDDGEGDDGNPMAEVFDKRSDAA
jgi:hypothetical protein